MSSSVTLVMVGFEHALAANVAVAFFVPALVYIAGAIGSQAVSVSVRGLSTHDVPIRALLRDEMLILAEEIVTTFLSTEFEGGRHARRVGQVMALEDHF